MTENKFFLRDGYTIEEKEQRILAKHFSIDNGIVTETIDDTSISIDDFREMNRDAKLGNLRNELSNQEYREFINDMFESYGKKGDKFNQQLYNLPPLSDVSNLDKKLEYFEGKSLTPTFNDIFTQPVYLNRIEIEDDHTTLRFNTASRTEEYESDKEIPILVLNEDGEIVSEIPEDQMVSIPTRTRVEVRIYKSLKYMSISNSDVPSSLQNEILNCINRIISMDLEADLDD